MKQIAITQIVLGLYLCFCSGSIIASEVDELRERAKALRIKAAMLAEQGDSEEARRLERESKEFLEIAERYESKSNGKWGKDFGRNFDKEVYQLKDRLHDLHNQERSLRENSLLEKKDNDSDLFRLREEIADLERMLQKAQRQPVDAPENRPELRSQVVKLEKAGQRIQHLRSAAEHLKLAEEHDMAHVLMERAESTERDVRAAKQRLAAEMQSEQDPSKERPDMIMQLKQENERLKMELRELKHTLEKRR